MSSQLTEGKLSFCFAWQTLVMTASMLNVIKIPLVRAFQITHYIVWMFAVLQSCAWSFFAGAPNVHSHLASEALAGLAAKEDFSHVQLKQGNTAVPNSEFVPYKKGGKMLLQVKGRRPCQVRLVRPHPRYKNNTQVASNKIWKPSICSDAHSDL